MKKNKICRFFAIFAFLMVAITSVSAASTSITGSTSAKTGDNVTITISGNQIAVWDLNVTYDTSKLELISGKTKLVGLSDSGKNENVTIATLVFKTKAAGSASISINGSISGEDKIKAETSRKHTVTISAPVTPPPVTPPPVVTPPTTTASSNANLKSLSLNVEGLNPAFSKSRTAYSLEVREDVNDIEVSASTEDKGATFYVSGNKGLAVGNNTINIVVTAADKKTKKTYKINVVKSNNPELSDASLQNLVVENIDLGVEFDKNITEYTCSEIEGDITKLNITAYATNSKAKVEILGNENLKIGENIITIKVTSESGLVTRDYVLKINKKEAVVISEVEIYDEIGTKDEPAGIVKFFTSVGSFLKRHWLVILLSIICIIELGIIILLVLMFKNKTGDYPFKLNRKEKNDDLDIISCVTSNSRRRSSKEETNKINLDNENKEEMSDNIDEQEILQKEIEKEIDKNK